MIINISSRDHVYLRAVEDFQNNLLTHSDTTTIVLMVFYIPVFFVAFGGNSLVLLVVLVNRHMRNVTNFLLLNLAVADLMVSLVCVPMAIGQAVYKAWMYGDFMCKFISFLQGSAVTASVFTIAILSLDRFLAIRKPLLFKRVSSTRVAVKLIVILWIFSLSVMLPMIWTREVQEFDILFGVKVTFCAESWTSRTHRLVYDTCLFVVVYFIPGAVITTSYSMIGKRLCNTSTEFQCNESEISHSAVVSLLSTRKRIAKMLIALAALFAICWLPYYVITIYINVNQYNLEDNDSFKHLLVVLPYTIMLGHSNSAINPVLYFYASRYFRKGVRKFFHCSSRRRANGNVEQLNLQLAMNADEEICRHTKMSPRKRRLFSRSSFSRQKSSSSFRITHTTNFTVKTKTTGSIAGRSGSVKAQKCTDRGCSIPMIMLAEPTVASTQCSEVEAYSRKKEMLDIPTTIREESRSRPSSPYESSRDINLYVFDGNSTK